MPTIDKVLPTAPHTTALESEPGGLGNLEKLPAELRQAVVDQLADDPHALAGFAATSKLALEHTDQGLKGLVPPAYQAATPNRLGEWTAQFRTLTPQMQQVLKATAGLFPSPDIFSPITQGPIAELHERLVGAQQAIAPNGYIHRAKLLFELLAKHAQDAGVPVPDSTAALLAAAQQAIASNGYIHRAKPLLELLAKHAQDAGVPVPDGTAALLAACTATRARVH